VISLIATVFNDKKGLELFFERMKFQTKKPDEIVLVDAGSRDGTWELMLQMQENFILPVRVFQEVKCKPSTGRNIAVTKSLGTIIAVTDIGCDWSDHWFEELVKPFSIEPSTEAVMGQWEVRTSDLEDDWSRADFILNNGYPFKATPQSHAANRSIAYTKEFYQRLGGLPEDLTFACDDMVLALLIQAHGKNIKAAPHAVCYWFRPTGYKALVKEAYRNFLGAGEAGIWKKHMVFTTLRLWAELLFLPVVLFFYFFGFNGIALVTSVLGAILLFQKIFKIMSRSNNVMRTYQMPKISFFKILYLDYILKIKAFNGYIKGYRNGGVACFNTRNLLSNAGY